MTLESVTASPDVISLKDDEAYELGLRTALFRR
jgi:hypothetical protein